MATYVKRGVIRVATDVSMTTVLSNPSSQFRGALIDLLEQVAAGIIANDPTIIAAAEAAVANALATKLSLSKCVHLSGGRWVWDGPNGASATHYILRVDGRWRTAATPFPTPSASRPAITWI
jgi:hypothetical protein